MAKKNKKNKKNKGNDFSAKLLVLMPFKRAMKNKLKARGVKPKSDKIADVASAFYETFLKGTHFEAANFEVENFALTAATVGVLISTILTWFKKHKEEKDQGGAIDAEDERAINEATADVATAEAAGTISKDGEGSTGGGSFSSMGIYGIIIIAVIIYLLMA